MNNDNSRIYNKNIMERKPIWQEWNKPRATIGTTEIIINCFIITVHINGSIPVPALPYAIYSFVSDYPIFQASLQEWEMLLVHYYLVKEIA